MTLRNLEFDGIDPNDYPDFCDAYVTYAENENGTPLTAAELEKIDAGDYYDEMYQTLID